ncbi:endonuclease MutS2 [Terriglobus roseus]|uniref:Endonuclease MutS2 n=1 Tax=Terriglobus roseus TaxID=392734 RepID=A0A1G7NZX0_9BACT|nr:Smr/MutS family protein [Terriglobus roseus]SDF79592.1 DNA mismatch repair protein MutS2 [Terriglobus roseus]
MRQTSPAALEWPRLREHLATRTQSSLGRARVLALEPTRELQAIERAQTVTQEIRLFLIAGGEFSFHGLFDANVLLDKARIPNASLEPLELRRIAELAEHIADWRSLITEPPDEIRDRWPTVTAISQPVVQTNFYRLLQLISGKIESDGSLADSASPELARIRKAMERQHKAIEESLRRQLRAVSAEGGAQEDLITIRGERFVIPVKTEFRRRVPGVIHGSSSSGQTVFVEPMETIEQNNELVRLLDEEQQEIHRILVAMTQAVGEQAGSIARSTEVLAEMEAHFAYAKFAQELDCVRPVFTDGRPHGDDAALSLESGRHPLLQLRMREERAKIVPLTLSLPGVAKQLIISGPNTGGKTVALKTVGLLALMAQAGLPVPASTARLPIFSGVYADIGDAQSIERNLSTFSAHISHVNEIAREADNRALVLLDELGSATDPEEGAALAVAISERFLTLGAWSIITTHLTSLKIYAAKHAGVVNAAVGFDERTLAPTYELRMGVPGASSGINIAERLGLEASIIKAARASVTTQSADIARFLDELHTQLTAVAKERNDLRLREMEVEREKRRLEAEGKNEQHKRARELESKLASLMKEFEYQMRESVKSIEDKGAKVKANAEADRRVARLKREFQESFNQTVVAHVSGADKKDPAAQPHVVNAVSAGDMVRLKSMRRDAKVERIIDDRTYEVSVGPMKMRVPKDDIAHVTVPAPRQSPLQHAQKRGIKVVAREPDMVPGEINVIGRTADEARDEVERFLDQAFLAGRPTVRVVHGTGMGILRRSLRDYLRKHPHVVSIEEPPYNEGGQGATLVQLRQ